MNFSHNTFLCYCACVGLARSVYVHMHVCLRYILLELQSVNLGVCVIRLVLERPEHVSL
jgi:hypothetical protein